MKVPLLDLKPQYQQVKDEILEATEDIYESQYFILGPKVESLEEDIARYCRCSHAVGVSSGTDALLISLMAAQIGMGDRVLTSPYTFFATAGAISRVGARPVFADINPDTYNLDPESVKQVLSRLSSKERSAVKAMIPVHLYGQCADMDPLLGIAREENWIVIEDAAQAIGSEYKGARAGSLGDTGCFSFFPSKNLGAFGDGGVVTTNSDSLYEQLKILRVHGSQPKYYHRFVGGNFRLDAFQAAVVSIKLKYLDGWTSGRQRNAETYRKLFVDAGLERQVTLPVEREDRHIYNQFVIRVISDRDELRKFLADGGIATEVYYPVPLHLQECFADLGYQKGDFPVSETAAEFSLALPIYPELTEEQQEFVVRKIKEFYSNVS